MTGHTELKLGVVSPLVIFSTTGSTVLLQYGRIKSNAQFLSNFYETVTGLFRKI